MCFGAEVLDNREFPKHYAAGYYALWEARSERSLPDIAIAEV